MGCQLPRDIRSGVMSCLRPQLPEPLPTNTGLTCDICEKDEQADVHGDASEECTLVNRLEQSTLDI